MPDADAGARNDPPLNRGDRIVALARRPDAQVAALAALMLAAAVVATLAVDDITAPSRSGGWVAFAVVVVLFGVVEVFIFNVQFRQEGISFTLSEIPMALMLVYLAPPWGLLARLAFGVPVLVLQARHRGVKLAFNLSLFCFEVMASYLLVRWLARGFGGGDAALLIAVILGLVGVEVITSIMISLAISRYDGRVREHIVSELQESWWLYPVTSVLAVMTITLSFVEPWLGALSLLPSAGMWYVLVRFARQNQDLRDLDTLYGFAGRIGGMLDVGEISEASVEEVYSYLRPPGVALLRFDDDGVRVHRRGTLDLELPTAADDCRWAELLGSDEIAVLEPDRLREMGVVRDVASPPRVLVAALRDQGETFGVLLLADRHRMNDGFTERDVVRLRDVADQLSVSMRRGVLHERLEYEARHDALTGLPARRLFEHAVEDALVTRGADVVAVMMLDLDRFKEVNDTLGHHAGDALLIEFSVRMSALLGPDDVLARLAGDEFAILCRRASFDDVLQMARSCLVAAGRPVTLDGLEIVVTVSVGVAQVLPVDRNALQPMRRADIAMYNAKWQRTGVESYRDEIDRRTPARLSMLGDLRTAIEDDQLEVLYQPKLDLQTGRITGAEALVRWEHSTRGIVPPTEFVRVAEDTGLIKDLTDLVLASGIAALRRFEDAGLDLGLSVNLSTHDLFDSRLPERVRSYLAEHGVRPERLTLEITESSLLVDAPRTRATLDELRAVGLRLAIDDFGTGYSSLSYLRRLPVHELKIDRSFVSGMLADPQDEVIVRSTVDLGRNLGLAVVAEGAESEDAIERLARFGCDVAQGYGIAAPMTSDALIEWVVHRDLAGTRLIV